MRIKLFQHDRKDWDVNIVNHTYQLCVIGNLSLIHVVFERDCGFSDGLKVVLGLFGNGNLFGLDFYVRNYILSFNFFTEYFPGWD